MKFRTLFFATALSIWANAGVFAQTNKTDSIQSNPKTLLEFFQKGTYGGQFRSFLMATDNAPGLSDYYAWAAGGSLHYKTARYHGFQFGLGGTYHYNVLSSDLTAVDPKTGARNRYEIGLFDVEDPQNRSNLDRLDELWLQYRHNQLSLNLGKQRIQTPLINHQDGRMRPTLVEGLWANWGNEKQIKIEGGLIWHISPRSTVKWYNIGKSIGLYPKGLNPDGTASGYAENLKSRGVGLLGLSRNFGKQTTVQLWNQYVDQIFNTVFAQVEHQIPLKNKQSIRLGLRALHQNALGDGGNSDQSRSYFTRGGQSNVVSALLSWQDAHWQSALAYTYVTEDGRFLSPREWGREPFYTFMARERIEGSGGSHAATARLKWQSTNRQLKAEIAYGQFYLPDIKQVALNKYAFPAFRQLNLDLRYSFKGWLEGLEGQLLFVWKGKTGDIYGNDKYVINKVELTHYNWILNYYF